jgi:Sulfotransferase domain
MLDLLDRDYRSVTFAEKSVLSLPDDSLRLRPLAEVRGCLAAVSAPLVVLKPLVESQRAPELLHELPGAKVIWMVRTYRDVAVSNVRTFGVDNPTRDLQLLLTNEPPNWRGEYVPPETRRVVGRFFSADLSPADAAALFWWARNMLVFQLGLTGRQDVHLCSYERLVETPTESLAEVYRFLNLPPPRRDPSRSVNANAVARGVSSRLLPEVDELCGDLYRRLESVFATPPAA